jgi:hypothetical protein
MTIGKQNLINLINAAQHCPNRYQADGPVLPESGNIEVYLSLPAHVVEAVGHYLDAHPLLSWDDVATLGLLLVAMPNDGDTRALHAEYLSRVFGKVA